ncbi:reverse transcriptase domain-containing protein [Pseudomonas prosekii]|uniref:reverse transcriptase domain-containing protein n=1 Tax=Pseudomonas prosekii TaxID=1148509 RepID=UPI00387AAFA7
MDEGSLVDESLRLTSESDVDDLAKILGTTYPKIKYLYYTKSVAGHYSTFSIPKKGGGKRQILAPDNQLKVLQKRLARQLSFLYKPNPRATAFLNNSSIVRNASFHTRKNFVFNIDLKDFFPSITFARVRAMLISQPYNLTPETATVIAHLATVDGKLPQGSPCSPVISNMICASLDTQLRTLAKKHKASYTRYADDITFSFYVPMQYLPEDIVLLGVNDGGKTHHAVSVGLVLGEIISKKGFTINPQKVRLQRRDEKQVVTGLIVNQKVNTDRRYIRTTAAMIHSLSTLGVDNANLIYKTKSPDASAELSGHVFGRLLFIHQVKGVDSPVYRRLAMRFNQLETPYKLPLAKLIEVYEDAGMKHNQLNIRRCWVVENNKWVTQATGFMLENNIMITCAHAFNYKLNPKIDSDVEYAIEHDCEEVWFDDCIVHRVNDRTKKYTAKALFLDKHRDLAIVSIDEADEKFEFFRLEETLQVAIDDKVSVLGFPNFKVGSTDVCRFWAAVNGKYVRSTIECGSVDKVLYSGNSGGPLLNSNQHVVGVVRRGAAGDPEGTNEFVCASEVVKVLKEFQSTLVLA